MKPPLVIVARCFGSLVQLVMVVESRLGVWDDDSSEELKKDVKVKVITEIQKKEGQYVFGLVWYLLEEEGTRIMEEMAQLLHVMLCASHTWCK